ncbi:MAG: uracil-DNA glycosylase family protein, partial [Anaerolineae bacterium]
RNLTESPLYDYRQEHGYSPVVGEGDPDARVMFIGEAPGKEEARTGRPFVGAAGRILEALFESVGLSRDEVYITNVVKDRPPENRDPRAAEIQLYAPFLLRQIQAIEPDVIVPLGRFATDFVLDRFANRDADRRISQIHGQPLEIEAGYGQVAVIPMFHPAAAFYAQGRREALQEDFQTLEQYL